MTLRRSLLTCLLLSVAALPAFAAEPMKVEKPWKTGVMRAPDGSFGYCVSEAGFENNLWLIVALNPQAQVNIGVGQKGIQLPVGGTRTSKLQVDDQPALDLPARVTKPELYVLNTADKGEALLRAIAGGSKLMVDGTVFSLTGSGAAMNTLVECVAARGEPTPPAQAQAQPTPAPAVPAAAPSDWSMPSQPDAATQVAQAAPAPVVPAPVAPSPLAPSPAAPQVVFDAPPTAPAAVPPPVTPAVTPPAAQATTQVLVPPAAAVAASDKPALIEAAPQGVPPLPDVAAPAPVAAAPVAPAPVAPAPVAAGPVIKPLPGPLANLLTNAGVRDIKPRELPTDGSSFAWTSRDMLGAVREDSATPGTDVAQLAVSRLEQLKPACAGTYTTKYGAVQSAGAMQIMTAQSRCRGQADVYTTYVFALTRAGVLSTISHGIDGGRRAAADRAQEGLVKALKGISG